MLGFPGSNTSLAPFRISITLGEVSSAGQAGLMPANNSSATIQYEIIRFFMEMPPVTMKEMI
jgi:hypothetical protein